MAERVWTFLKAYWRRLVAISVLISGPIGAYHLVLSVVKDTADAVERYRSRTTDNVFVSCSTALFALIPTDGNLHLLDVNALSESEGGYGLTEYWGNPGARYDFMSANHPGSVPAYRCEVTTSRTLLDVSITVRLLYRDPIFVVGQANTTKQGQVWLDRDWQVPIRRLMPNDKYVFYIQNLAPKYVTVSIRDRATARDGDVAIDQPERNLYDPLLPVLAVATSSNVG